jgi:CheY-like chemotaxis protein
MDNPRVLLIEDDCAVAEMYRLRLELGGCRVLVAGDGEEGLREALDHPPDLICLDVRLPRMDGLEVLEQLRAHASTRPVPVVVLTCYNDPEVIRRARELGAVDHLVKADISPSSLTSRIREWLTATPQPLPA